MPITTTESMRTNRGQMCAECKQRVAVCRYKDGQGWLCPDCDPREQLVREVDEATPVDRGKG
jgi:uncharacterized protein YlaI